MRYSFTVIIAMFFASIGSSASAQVHSGTINGDGSSTVIAVETVGGFEVTQVKVDNKVLVEGVDYTVKSNGSSRPTITLVNPPAAGDTVTVTGTADNKDPDLKLSWSNNTIVHRIEAIADSAGLMVSVLLKMFGL